MRVVYSPHYNIAGYGIEKLHPFDGRKFERAWAAIGEALGEVVARSLLVAPDSPVPDVSLQRVHTADYLQSIRSSAALAKIFEVPQAAWIPFTILDHVVLKAMRWATQGTIVACREALAHGLAINLGGGYHHAKPDRGEGFNVYNDVAVAIAELRSGGELSADDGVLYVDADAHQGNGICHCFLNDRSLKNFDIFNSQIYPQADSVARQRIDHAIELTIGTGGEDYLLQMERALPTFVEEICREKPPALAVYNAGTDVLATDPLGALDLLPEHVLERDVFTLQTLRRHGIPSVMVLGGGYTQESYRLVADTVIAMQRRVQ
jgi:histone deacetylase 11